jgi:hypothetical protein
VKPYKSERDFYFLQARETFKREKEIEEARYEQSLLRRKVEGKHQFLFSLPSPLSHFYPGHSLFSK